MSLLVFRIVDSPRRAASFFAASFGAKLLNINDLFTRCLLYSLLVKLMRLIKKCVSAVTAHTADGETTSREAKEMNEKNCVCRTVDDVIGAPVT